MAVEYLNVFSFRLNPPFVIHTLHELSRSPRRSSVPADESSRQSEAGPCRIGLAALQHKALQQQEQLSRTSLGFRFPVDVSPTSSTNANRSFFEAPRDLRRRVKVLCL